MKPFQGRGRSLLASGALLLAAGMAAADDFDTTIKPLLAAHCVKCHGKEKTKGKVNLHEIRSAEALLAAPKLIHEIIKAVDAGDMPPETEAPLRETSRAELLAALKSMLRVAASGQPSEEPRASRLNRFQYNNSVRDLFRLKTDLFRLPEKLMTRQSGYLTSRAAAMPDRVNVTSQVLDDQGGFRDVEPYPKDPRAQHGFDNQTDQLTLSPILLEAFLRLGVSIVESPDFNEASVGIWNDFFREPAAGVDRKAEIRSRLRPFLAKAFRGAVDDPVLDRYVNYALAKVDKGLPFTVAMKKAASAVLSSPRFLYRSTGGKEDRFALASKLSYFLWGSAPDEELLALAGKGELSKPDVLGGTLARMIADPKIERLLDSFPSQWLQLENIRGAAPDPKLVPYYHLDEKTSAGTQMALEPLLLFDAVFLEDRSILDLISPPFSYRSDFLQTWYLSDLKVPKADPVKLIEINRALMERRESLQASVRTAQAELAALLDPVRARLLQAKKREAEAAGRTVVDLKPYAAWEFNGDLKDSISGRALKAEGKIRYQDGMVVLDNAYLRSEVLPIELKAKTMEVWLKLKDLKQRGGGAMTLQGPGGYFDSIVLGERTAAHWISGSDGFARTQDFEGSTPEGTAERMLHLAMVYAEDGLTTLYRDGIPAGKPYRKGAAIFPKQQSSVLFGLRHLPAGEGKFLAMSLDRARLYDRALSAEEVAASGRSENLTLSDDELLRALDPGQKAKRTALTGTLKEFETALKNVPPPMDSKKQQQDIQQGFESQLRNAMRAGVFQRVSLSDPRYGGVITNAATMIMTSAPTRTLPIARGAWMIEVILNDPPPPPPNDIPPLDVDDGAKEMTIREKFARHRENPSCAGCHARIDPLGFALENFDIAGRWRDRYENGRAVDSSGTFLKKHEFQDVVQFKSSLIREKKRFAKAFTAHLLRFALARELRPEDALAVEGIVEKAAAGDYRIQSLIREIVFSDRFLRPD